MPCTTHVKMGAKYLGWGQIWSCRSGELLERKKTRHSRGQSNEGHRERDSGNHGQIEVNFC